MKATYKHNEEYKIIVVTFADSCDIADCSAIGDVSDSEIDAACSANGSNIEGWTCNLEW